MDARLRRGRMGSTCAVMGIVVGVSGCDPSLFVGIPRLCGGLLGLECRGGEYCQFEDGVCGPGDQTGACTAIPEVCTQEFGPVCGCDGETYDNPCFAAAAGASVDHEGSCESICGGIAGLTCLEGQFCLFDDGICGDGDQSGTCMALPDACTEEFAPVCGCDGVTYSNECFANAAGVSIRSAGECPADGEPGPG